jgi:UDP-glucose 4-epimerase
MAFVSSLPLPRVDGVDGARVVVTGGAGFIGSTLVRVLKHSGAHVTAYDNLATGHAENVRDVDADTAGGSFRFVHGDIRDREKLARLLDGVDVVFHLACLGVRHSIHSPIENLDVNARGTLHLLVEARAANVKRFVHVSTSEVYGTAKTVPMTEEHPTDPHTVYGASKLDGECSARAFFRCYGFPVVVVRPFNSYGPRSHSEGDSGEVIPRFLVRALCGKAPVVFGDGTQTRDFTHVYDTATGIALAGVRAGVAGETFNVGAGKEVTIAELGKIVLQAVERPDLAVEHIEPRPGDVLRLFANSEKARLRLGYQPQVSLHAGLADLAGRLQTLGDVALRALDAGIVIRNWV